MVLFFLRYAAQVEWLFLLFYFISSFSVPSRHASEFVSSISSTPFTKSSSSRQTERNEERHHGREVQAHYVSLTWVAERESENRWRRAMQHQCCSRKVDYHYEQIFSRDLGPPVGHSRYELFRGSTISIIKRKRHTCSIFHHMPTSTKGALVQPKRPLPN